jgi:hypothetical protein
VQACLSRRREIDITWPLPVDFDEAQMVARLYQRVAHGLL